MFQVLQLMGSWVYFLWKWVRVATNVQFGGGKTGSLSNHFHEAQCKFFSDLVMLQAASDLKYPELVSEA